MGTTLVVAVFRDGKLLLGHVGDSRCYRLRGGRLQQLTRDHSLLQEQIDAGLISPEQAQYATHKNLVTRALGQSGLDPHLLDLELTESSVLEDSETLVGELAQIRALGCEISIDDFGTGYSSLRYVKRFPVDRLKIDQSFIRNLPHDPNDVAIVRTVMALGHSLDLSIIAEGVETEAQRDFLASEGCDEFQGYLFSKPLPFDAFVEFALGRAGLARKA
jgi:EAL domain-containing protein (putative c-di-GMP-specific phosphodiesterase class I)